MPRKVFSIFPTYAVEYNRFAEWERSSCSNQLPPVRSGTRLMSKESRKELMNSVNWLKLFSPMQTTYCKDQKKKVTFRLNFITLTLSGEQTHPDSYIKKHMLEPFLKWMSRKGAASYAWKAETQNNGNLHFHITSNTYIYWKSIRIKWNDLQYNHGYLKSYFKRYGHHDPNSTDVHAVRDDSEIGIYICKEFGKVDSWSTVKDQKLPAQLTGHPSRFIAQAIGRDEVLPLPKRQVDGRKWSISNNLVGLRCFIDIETPGEFETTTAFLKAQDFRHISMDFAKLWFYPHLIDGKAPERIVQKLKELKRQVTEYE